MSQTITIAVVDDHPLFREGVVRSLSEMEAFDIVATGGSLQDSVKIAKDQKPAVYLLDISMPGGGLNAIEPILQSQPEARIIMLTVSESGDDISCALGRGAMGFVLKGVGSRALGQIIRAVAAGGSYVPPMLSAKVISALSAGGNARNDTKSLNSLTAREQEILELVAQGQTNKRVALKLNLNEKTVKHHMSSILFKLDLQNRTEAALWYRDQMAKPALHS